MKSLPTTWAMVCKAKGIEAKIPFDVSMLPKEMQNYLIACYRLPIIIEALNGDDFVLDYTDMSQRKYELWLEVKADKKRPSGFGLAYDASDYWYTVTNAGSRFVFKDEETAIHAFKYFEKDFVHHHLKVK